MSCVIMIRDFQQIQGGQQMLICLHLPAFLNRLETKVISPFGSSIDLIHGSPRITAEWRGRQTGAVHEIGLWIIFPGVAHGDGRLHLR